MKVAIELDKKPGDDICTMALMMRQPSGEHGERLVQIDCMFHSFCDLKRCLEMLVREVDREIA